MDGLKIVRGQRTPAISPARVLPPLNDALSKAHDGTAAEAPSEHKAATVVPEDQVASESRSEASALEALARISDLEALVQAQQAQLQSLTARLSSDEPSKALVPEDDDKEDGGNCSDLDNLFSYGIEMALDPKSSSLEIFKYLAILSILGGMQTSYAFGYYDASQLLQYLVTLPAYADPMDKSLWYSTTHIDGTTQPFINIVCSVCSLAQLSLLIKIDNDCTMLTTAPLQVLLLSERWWRRPGRALLCIWLQMEVLFRALILPLYAAHGAACNFAGARDAQDVVLNSVAIGFVFEVRGAPASLATSASHSLSLLTTTVLIESALHSSTIFYTRQSLVKRREIPLSVGNRRRPTTHWPRGMQRPPC